MSEAVLVTGRASGVKKTLKIALQASHTVRQAITPLSLDRFTGVQIDRNLILVFMRVSEVLFALNLFPKFFGKDVQFIFDIVALQGGDRANGRIQ